MDPEKLTHQSQQALAAAVKLATDAKNAEVNSLHLLLALLTGFDSVVVEILKQLEASPAEISQAAQEKLEAEPKVEGGSQPRVARELAEVLNQAEKQAKSLGDDYVSREHLLLALSLTDCQASAILKQANVTADKINAVLKDVRGGEKVTDQNPEGKYQALEKFTTNLTELARAGKLDPVIGRNEEIRRLMQVLSRRTKNNPVLIGDPGVGKTAIAEGLAQRVASGDVPETLKDKEVLVLDLASILAGSKFRGEFEDRLKAVLKQIQKGAGRYLLFIDELHTLVGAGAAEGAIDAANILKPALARGELHAIGATTVSEYRQHIEKDAALERRFQPVLINPPSVADTVSILRGLKEKYEVHHGIKITDDAVVAAAKLSDRYIADRFLPDKAIDLVDEATSGLKIESESQPEELDQLKRQITQLEIEQAALKKEKSKTAQARLAEIKKNLAPLKEKETKLKLRWASQKELLTKIQKLQGQADELKTRLETLEREVKLEEAAKIKYGDLPQIEKELTKLQETWEKIPDEDKILKLSVTEEDIAQVVSRWSGVPVAKLLSTEAEKLAHLEDELHQRVVNQDEAVREVAGAIRRSRAGISEETRPIGSFIFMGPTGVGKTELAKALAEVLFGDEKALVRTDMSEYSESHSLARLIGAPPGYVGFEEGGQLTEAVRRKPYSVILFDEIEKAHPQIFNAFLQILDEGRLTDGKGRTISFKNTVVIMTSNLGGNIIQDYAGKKDKQEEMKQKIWELVNQSFRPEFINRLDQIIIFDQLTPEMLNSIVKLQLDRVNRRLADKKITLKVTPAAEKYLSQKGFDDAFGARPLKRVIQNEILDPLSLMIIENKVKEGTTVTIDAAKGALTLKA